MLPHQDCKRALNKHHFVRLRPWIRTRHWLTRPWKKYSWQQLPNSDNNCVQEHNLNFNRDYLAHRGFQKVKFMFFFHAPFCSTCQKFHRIMQLAPKAFRPRKATHEKFLETLPGVGKLMTVDDERAQSRAQFEISGNLTENRNPQRRKQGAKERTTVDAGHELPTLWNMMVSWTMVVDHEPEPTLLWFILWGCLSPNSPSA